MHISNFVKVKKKKSHIYNSGTTAVADNGCPHSKTGSK